MQAPPSNETAHLLDPNFLRELEVLRRRLQVRARSGAMGDHVAKRRGGAAEFAEHRAYAPGDDMRRIDWAAYARTGEPVLKLFRAEEDRAVRIAIDGSKSLAHGGPSKLDVGRRVAAAFGYMALAGSERTEVFVCGEGLAGRGATSRGRAGLPSFLRSLSAIEAQGKADLAKAIDALVERSARPGLLLLVSDFFDRGPVVAALGRAVAAGHDAALVQVLTPDEIEPDFEGDFLLEDAETGETVDLTADPEAIEAYVLRFTALCESLRAFARRHGATYVRVRTDEPIEGAVRRLVARSVD